MKHFTIFCELLLNQLINLLSVSITLFVECFSTIFINITYVLCKWKCPCKAGWNVYMGKNVPPLRDPGFMNVRSLLSGRIYFHINRFWFFNRILLYREISLNRGSHFAGMFFLHINTPQVVHNSNPANACNEDTITTSSDLKNLFFFCINFKTSINRMTCESTFCVIFQVLS